MNIRYPIYEGVYRILTEESRKARWSQSRLSIGILPFRTVLLIIIRYCHFPGPFIIVYRHFTF